MNKALVFLIHILFWLCFLVLGFVIIGAVTHGFSSGPNFTYLIKFAIPFVLLPSLSTFYLFYLFLFPKYIQTGKTGLALLYSIFISLSCAFLSGLLINLLLGTEIMFKGGYTGFLTEILSMALIGFVVGVVSVIIKGFIKWYDEVKAKEELSLKNHSIELALVKSQLDPHFLFNTINNIDVLILKSPEIASGYLNKLSDILRFMLFESKTEKIDLSKEIAYIKKYVELQKIRTSNENYVNFTVHGEIANTRIPSMVFIPFIENAFKHVSSKKIDNAIRISLTVENKNIIFECENKFNESNNAYLESHGLGNDLIQKRIELLYPEKHSLCISNQNNTYKVNLVLTND